MNTPFVVPPHEIHHCLISLITGSPEPFGNELWAVAGTYNRLDEVFFSPVVSHLLHPGRIPGWGRKAMW